MFAKFCLDCLDMRWQVQEAKQRLSELLRRAETEGAQFVTKHGEEVAVVIDIAHYRRLSGVEFEIDFKHALTAEREGTGATGTRDVLADALDDVAGERADDLPREADLQA